MKKISALLVAIIGVVCIVFGVLFIMQAGESRDTLVKELQESNLTLSTLNAAYDQAKAGLAQATTAKSVEGMQTAGWQKASLGSAKTSASTISFVEKTGMVVVIVGVGFALAGLGLLKKE